MFVFALIKAGVSEMKQVVEKQQHEKELKGKITEKNKKQTEKNISKVNKSLNEIAEYEDIISDKMKEMNQFVTKLQDNKKVMKDLIEDQRRKETLLVVVQEKIEEAEEKAKNTKLKNEKLSEVLKKKQVAIQKLDKEKINLNQNIVDLKQKLNTIDERLIVEQKVKKELNQKLDETRKVVEAISQEKEQRDYKIQGLEKQIVENKEKTNVKIKSLNNHLEQKILLEKELNTKLNNKIVKMKNLDQMVKDLENQVSQRKEELANTRTKVLNQDTIINEQSKRISRLDSWKMEKNKVLVELNNSISSLRNEKNDQINQNKQLKIVNNELFQKKNQLENNLNKKVVQFNQASLKLIKLNLAHENVSTELKKIQFQRKNLLIEKQNSDTKLVQYEDLIDNLQQENSTWKSKANNLEDRARTQVANINHLSQENLDLKNSKTLLDQNLAKSKRQLKDLNGKAEYYEKTLSDKNIDIETLTASLGNARSQISNYKGQLSGAQEMNEQFQYENGQIQQQLSGQQLENSNLRKEKNVLLSKLNQLKSIKGQASRKIASVEAEVDTIKIQHEQQMKALNSCKNQKNGLVETNQDLKESLNDFATKVANVKGKLRSSIASDLANAFKRAKLNVMVDKKTGNVVFLMDKNFRFKKNSAYLNKAARRTLKKVIPIYSKVLFGNKDIKDKVAGFNVVGHASPSHGGHYVAPLSQNSRAYSYNMRLSAQRAASVTNYIFGNKIGRYSYKKLLKDFTRAIGQGYTKPIKQLGRKIASKGACGPSNCHASQRVELSFTLKDDVDSINKLIQMAKDIK